MKPRLMLHPPSEQTKQQTQTADTNTQLAAGEIRKPELGLQLRFVKGNAATLAFTQTVQHAVEGTVSNGTPAADSVLEDCVLFAPHLAWATPAQDLAHSPGGQV